MPIWDDGTLEYPIRNERHLISRRAVARGEPQRARRSGGEVLHGWSWKTKEEGFDSISRKPVEKVRVNLDSRFPHLKLWKKWITWNSLVSVGGNPS